MKIDKSFKEVWEWKDRAYKETKGLSMRERGKYINQKAEALCRRLHLRKVKKASSLQ